MLPILQERAAHRVRELKRIDGRLDMAALEQLALDAELMRELRFAMGDALIGGVQRLEFPLEARHRDVRLILAREQRQASCPGRLEPCGASGQAERMEAARKRSPWRKERDSNPRWAVNPHTLSRRAT